VKRQDGAADGGMTAADQVMMVLEAVLFIADEPLPTSDLALLFELPADEVEARLAVLAERWQVQGRGVVLRRVGGGWRLATHPDTAPYLERFVGEHRAGRLTQAALETLAIVAYRQPISRTQLAEVRGVSCDAVVRTLVSRGMVQEVGRDEGPGQAILYGTTTYFLERLGLDSVGQLPPLADFMPDRNSVERMESGLGPGL
jgi:segregation and condensation protein B